jgi:transcriptional regulator with XRE-family HTH domain
LGYASLLDEQVDLHIGKRLRRRRIQLGLTQSQVAIGVGVRFQQIHKYECAACRISAARLWLLAQVLDVAPSYFFDGLQLESPEGCPVGPGAFHDALAT